MKIGTYEILFVLLGLGSFVFFRWYSRHVLHKSDQSPNARLARISKASFLFQYFISFGLIVSVYWVLAFLFGWQFFSHIQRLVAAPGHFYNSPAETPLSFAAGVTLLALFNLYRRGILFSAKNVLYIRLQGYYLILGYIVDYQMQSRLHDMALSSTPLLIGLLIIFFAWIMDEGRKIKEEQELTV